MTPLTPLIAPHSAGAAELKESGDSPSGRYPLNHQRRWLRVDALGRLSYVAVRLHPFIGNTAV